MFSIYQQKRNCKKILSGIWDYIFAIVCVILQVWKLKVVAHYKCVVIRYLKALDNTRFELKLETTYGNQTTLNWKTLKNSNKIIVSFFSRVKKYISFPESRSYLKSLKVQPNLLSAEQFRGGYISAFQFYNQFHAGFCSPYIYNPNYMLIVDFR